jgi:hypothetical protein
VNRRPSVKSLTQRLSSMADDVIVDAMDVAFVAPLAGLWGDDPRRGDDDPCLLPGPVVFATFLTDVCCCAVQVAQAFEAAEVEPRSASTREVFYGHLAAVAAGLEPATVARPANDGLPQLITDWWPTNTAGWWTSALEVFEQAWIEADAADGRVATTSMLEGWLVTALEAADQTVPDDHVVAPEFERSVNLIVQRCDQVRRWADTVAASYSRR